MTLHIAYQSQSFPGIYSVPKMGTLTTSWDELLWAAITIGRPSIYHIFQHGPASFYEAIFRLSLIRMAVEQDLYGRLRRTDAYSALDPTEKGMVSYFLGMTLCKLFATKLLFTPWLLHLDVFRSALSPAILGRSRPDLVGQNGGGEWHAFESKGRSSSPSSEDKNKAKFQAERLVSVNGVDCSLHIGSFAFFRNDILEFYWRDPEPGMKEPIRLPRPSEEWRYYYDCALSLSMEPADSILEAERKRADIKVAIHPEIRPLLYEGAWSHARDVSLKLREEFIESGYEADGILVTAGSDWSRPFGRSERLRS